MEYRTLYIDPPWKICSGGKGKKWGTPQNHYPVMATPDIVKSIQWVKPLIAEQAHCYLWVVNNKLQDGLNLLKELGFTYITNLVWVKNKIGMGQYFRGQHELLFFGRKGKPMPYCYENGKKVTISTVIPAPKSIHSRKPHLVYEIIERQSPAPYLELFARNNRLNWYSWGNELDVNNSGTVTNNQIHFAV